MISFLATPNITPKRTPLVFTGKLPDPARAGLYRYDDLFDSPAIGSRPVARPASIDTFETTAPMARWLAENDHERPFFRDPDFVAEFGRISKAEAIAVVNALWLRADRAAAAAGTTIALPARLGGSGRERKCT